VNHLFLGTQKDNISDMMSKRRNGYVILRGEASPRSKLTWDQVDEIKKMKLPQRKIAAMFGVSQGTVSFIKSGITWKQEFKESPRLTLLFHSR
jgi:hypothetical protein